MSDRPNPDQPEPGEHDRTIVDQPTESNLEHDATIKNAPNTGEFEATIKNAATGGSVPSHRKTELSVGSRFGRYELKKELGRGAMGVVYLAHDTNLDRKVALKVPSFSEDDGDDIVDRFYREARAMATIHHPNLCPVYDVAEIDGVHYLTMQFIEGRPLSDFVQASKTHTPKQVAAVLRKLALALDAAHQAGIVHRDLKPANIMISAANEPVIMDFGLAQRRKQNETTLTQSGQLMGTPAYMSPEQVKGDQDLIGPPSDVYALGVICYQLLTGKLPFTGSLGEVMAGILTQEPERPSKAGNSKVDRSIEAICLKAMAREMEDRYASAGELAQSLKDYMRGKRMPDEVTLPAPTDSSPGIAPSGSVYTSRQEAQLADDFFADLEREQSATSLPPRRTKKKKGNRKKKGARAGVDPLWLKIGGGVGLLLLLGVIVLLFPGGDGTIRIEINDPEVEVTVGDNRYKIKGTAQEDIELEPGEHLLTVTRGDISFKTDKFLLQSGEMVVIKVENIKDEIQVTRGETVVARKSIPTIPTPVSRQDDDQGRPGTKPAASEAPVPAIAPFDAKQARAYQEAWAKHLGEPVVTTNSIGMKLAVIPPGEFLMGSTDEEIERHAANAQVDWRRNTIRSEGPQHRVTMTQPFLMSTCEVTRGQFRAFVEDSKYETDGEGGYGPQDDHPAINVSWNDAKAFCKWLSKKEGVTYRLPTEAQWEYTCRAGTTTLRHCGDSESAIVEYAWISLNAEGQTHPVGEKKPNPWSLHDMYGNVWELCADWNDTEYYGRSPRVDPPGPERDTNEYLVVRGGSWRDSAEDCRSAYRPGFTPDTRRSSLGFRVVLVLERQTKQANASANSKGAEDGSSKSAIAPFNADQAKAHQETWAKKRGKPVVTTNSIGMKLAVIPPGSFKMGDPDRAVEVTLTKPFRLGIHEVTQGQWKAVMGSEPWKRKPQTIEGENVPATSVSWTNAQTFCQMLTERERAAGRLSEDRAYRLPTEAEWEWACRAGTTTAYSFGNEESKLGEYAWYDSNAKNAGEAYAHAVGLKKPNPWGLFDVHGNVWELCADWSGGALPGGTDPTGPTEGSNLMGRGGSWGYTAVGCRSAIRQGWLPSSRNINLGFRVALGPVADKAAVPPNSARTPTADGQDTRGQPEVTPPTQARKAPPPAKAPFGKKQALAHQAAWAKHLGLKVLTTNSIGMKMRLIPPGEFLMGSSQEELQKVMAEARKRKYAESWIREFLREGPQHRVTLTKPFRLAVHEVTRGQFRQFVVAAGYQTNAEKDGKDVHGYKGGKSIQVSKHPVVNVSWNDAVAFCEWLSKKEGVTYHLPTEAQWEFACRAGSPARFSFGDEEALLNSYAWYGGRSTMPVGTKAANAFALFDMHGNVWEWCNDGLVSYTAAPALDPVGPAQGGSGLMRGGAFRLPSMLVRSTTRFPSTLSNASVDLGFRVAVVLKDQ